MQRSTVICFIIGLLIATMLVPAKAQESTPSTTLHYQEVDVTFSPNALPISLIRLNPKNNQLAIGYQQKTDIDILESLNEALPLHSLNQAILRLIEECLN